MATKTKRKHHGLLVFLITFFLTLVVLISAFFAYASKYYHATDHALSYLTAQQDEVKITKEKDYYTFEPTSKSLLSLDKGFIFYPGGKVQTEAYVPMMVGLAKKGVTGILVHMPFNLAFNGINKANNKQELFPKINHWFLGGHSLGGAMASTYLNKHAEGYDGLVMLASFSTKDLSKKTFNTLSLLGENDEVLNKDKYESNKKNLPNLTEYTIKGGIHSYFGDYGIQKGDGTPTITNDEQRAEVVAAMTLFMKATVVEKL